MVFTVILIIIAIISLAMSVVSLLRIESKRETKFVKKELSKNRVIFRR